MDTYSVNGRTGLRARFRYRWHWQQQRLVVEKEVVLHDTNRDYTVRSVRLQLGVAMVNTSYTTLSSNRASVTSRSPVRSDHIRKCCGVRSYERYYNENRLYYISKWNAKSLYNFEFESRTCMIKWCVSNVEIWNLLTCIFYQSICDGDLLYAIFAQFYYLKTWEAGKCRKYIL